SVTPPTRPPTTNTCAPGTPGPPDLVTTPRTVPVVPWARRSGGAVVATERTRLIIISPRKYDIVASSWQYGRAGGRAALSSTAAFGSSRRTVRPWPVITRRRVVTARPSTGF